MTFNLHVKDDKGAPIEGAFAVLYGLNVGYANPRTTDGNGFADLPSGILAAGTPCLIVVEKDGYKRATSQVEPYLTVGPDNQDVVIEVVPFV